MSVQLSYRYKPFDSLLQNVLTYADILPISDDEEGQIAVSPASAPSPPLAVENRKRSRENEHNDSEQRQRLRNSVLQLRSCDTNILTVKFLQ